MNVWPEPVVLSGRTVRLEPLERRHADELAQAVRDGELWKLWYTMIPAPDAMEAFVDERLAGHARGALTPFAVISIATDRAVGMTNYLNVEPAHRRVEIGGTWYAKSVQRTALNTEAKRLLLGHAFDMLDCIAVEFRTHFFNHQSRRGIERLGAKLDGVLRSHQILPDGSMRDTCVYSITAAEWPTVKNHLDWQLARPR